MELLSLSVINPELTGRAARNQSDSLDDVSNQQANNEEMSERNSRNGSK